MTKYPQQVVEGVAGTVPLGRLGTEEEFAWLVAYVASPAGDYLSGAILTIDGARDNWLGAWPPGGLTDEAGKPLAEERKPSRERPRAATERLVMRGFREEDLDALAEISADSEVTRWVGDPDGLSREETWRRMAYFIGHWELRGFGQWALFEQATGELVGRAGLLPARGLARAGGGLAGRARALGPRLRARGGPGVDGVGARRARRRPHHQPDRDDNDRSARVAEKLGMTVEGRTRIVDGEIRGAHLWGRFG